MADIDVRQIMEDIPNHFNPEKAEGVTGTVQCRFSGSQSSDWVIRIKDQTCTVEEGVTQDADLTIRAKGEDGVRILTGDMDPMRAFMLGKVKVVGEMALGMKLANLFNR